MIDVHHSLYKNEKRIFLKVKYVLCLYVFGWGNLIRVERFPRFLDRHAPTRTG